VRRLGMVFVFAASIALALCFLGGCKGDGAQEAAASTGPPKGSIKFPTPEEKAARQEAARAKGIEPDPRGGPPAGGKSGAGGQ